MKNNVKYLVTGAAGFLGGTICRQLIERGENVRAFVLPGDPAMKYVPQEAEIVEGDLTDMASLEKLFAVEEGTATIVLHIASIVTVNPDYSSKVMEVNVDGTKNIIRLCLSHPECKKLVYTDLQNYGGGYDGRDYTKPGEPMVAGEYHDYTIYLQPTVYTFEPGHRAVLVVTGWDPYIEYYSEEAGSEKPRSYSFDIDNAAFEFRFPICPSPPLSPARMPARRNTWYHALFTERDLKGKDIDLTFAGCLPFGCSCLCMIMI